MHRRRFIQTAAVLPAVFMATRRHAFAEETARIIWSVPRNQVPAVRDTLDFSGTVTPDATSAPNTRALPLLFIFIGVASIPSLVSTLASVYKDIRYGGVVVTARDGRFQIMNDPHLSGGTIVVYGDNGVEIHHSTPDSELNTGELLKSLTALATRSPVR